MDCGRYRTDMILSTDGQMGALRDGRTHGQGETSIISTKLFLSFKINGKPDTATGNEHMKL